MQPIFAESAPHRGRAIVAAVALAVIASLAALAARPHPSHHRQHHLRFGQCRHVGYVYVVR